MEKTVKEVVAILQKMNQDAIVCRSDGFDENTSIEIICSLEKAKFINDKGDEDVAPIVVIY